MPTTAFVSAIEYALPESKLTNEALAAQFPEWSVEKIQEKTGITARGIAGPDQCASDLGMLAAKKLFDSGSARPDEIDYLLFCTQSPDYLLPTTACILQDRLGIPTSSGALDFNLGCSGFVFGLGIAKGLIETEQAKKVLLITADTYSKHIHHSDKSVRTLFGDGAAATLLSAVDSSHSFIGPFVYGTDGSGHHNLIVPTGGMRRPRTAESAIETRDASGNCRSADNLYMDGSEIFNFTLSAVPRAVHELLRRTSLTIGEIDWFVFHQANGFMLEHLRKKLQLPLEKFYTSFRNYGNTVSSTIPIALKDAITENKIKSGQNILLVGFGVGYSWGATLVRWSA